MKKNREVRCMVGKPEIEVREDGSIERIYGYAAVFDRDSEDMGFIERIAQGAFKDALKSSDVRGLKNHDSNLIFARQGVNLKLKEDERGLFYEATPVDTQTYRQVAEEIREGLLTGQSFSFTVLGQEWNKDYTERIITKIGELFDVGPVTFPAYNDTTVALRSIEAARQQDGQSAAKRAREIDILKLKSKSIEGE